MLNRRPKAKGINKYLGKDYTVLASFSHVRDLPEKTAPVDPDNDFAPLSWEEQGDAKKRLKDIADAVKNADGLVLATDPDREGEAISWHVLEVLRKESAGRQAGLPRRLQRHHQKRGFAGAMAESRDLDTKLVDACWPAARWTIWSALIYRPYCGANYRGRARPVACNQWHCV